MMNNTCFFNFYTIGFILKFSFTQNVLPFFTYKLLRIKTYILGLFLVSGVSLQAQPITESNSIANFIVKENSQNGNQLLVQAIDTAKQNNSRINGTFTFYVNGFTQALEFKDGQASCELKLRKSSFIYFKHENETSNPSNLYYVYKGNSGLNPFKISWLLLVAIPIGLVLIGYMFKKIIGLAIFLLAAYFYFNHSGGLSVGTFFESVFDGLRNLF